MRGGGRKEKRKGGTIEGLGHNEESLKLIPD